MIRFAIRRLSDGSWRSARWSDAFGEWRSAQLWENAKTAEREVRRWAENERWSRAEPVRVPDPIATELVAVNITEPQ